MEKKSLEKQDVETDKTAPAICACSAMTLTSESGRNYWFRTCDIDTDIWKDGAHVVSFPAGSRISFEGREEKEECRYAFVGITDNKKDTWVLDGINEKGLTGGLLMLNEGTSAQCPPEGSEGYVGMELAAKFLSVCESVEEVIRLAERLIVLSIPFEGKFVPATMHYMFADPSGNEVILEAVKEDQPGVFTVYRKPEEIGVMTNSPAYDKQLDNLKWYLSQSPELKKGINGEALKVLRIGGKEVKGDENAPHLLKSATFPASYCSCDRFVRLAVLKALNEDGKHFEDGKMLALGSGIMSAVFEPSSKGVFHYARLGEKGEPIGNKNSCTQYLVMYDLEERSFYLRPLDAAAFTRYALKDCKEKEPARYEVKHEGMAGILNGIL